MKLRTKVVSMNMLIIIAALLVGSFCILRLVDNFNLYTVYQYLSGQSEFSRQYLTEFLKMKRDPEAALEGSKTLLEGKFGKQVGCSVKITGLKPEDPTALQKSALKGTTSYLIDTRGPDRVFRYSFPIHAGSQVVGTVLYEYPLYQADQMRRSLMAGVAILLAVSLLASLLLSTLFSYRLIRPLEKLTKATEEFSRGNFKEIDPSSTRDEVEVLTRSFNGMGLSLRDMIAALRNEQEKQKKFLDNVTHEIRTPLTNILGYADLSERVGDAEQRSLYLSRIGSEGNRLLHMVNNLLELSRINRYEFSLDRKDTDMRALIAQTVELMSDRARKYGFQIRSEMGDSGISANVDGEKIKQALMNLIDNAVKYSGGSRITVRLWRENGVHVRVEDNGKGIPEADLANILEPFYRVDKSRSRQLGGSGLGLSICRDIAAAHGGNLRIESKEGAGTIVTLSLQP